MHALLLLFFLFLTRCSSPALTPICPSLVPYSTTDQKAVATELRAYPELNALPRWISDYIGLRNQVRACSSSLASSPFSKGHP